jgi:hypothetical protein
MYTEALYRVSKANVPALVRARLRMLADSASRPLSGIVSLSKRVDIDLLVRVVEVPFSISEGTVECDLTRVSEKWLHDATCIMEVSCERAEA